MVNKRKRGDYAGWFAEIPRDLKEEFVKLYPRRRDIKLFTVAFVSWAVRLKPDIRSFAAKEGWTDDCVAASKAVALDGAGDGDDSSDASAYAGS